MSNRSSNDSGMLIVILGMLWVMAIAGSVDEDVDTLVVPKPVSSTLSDVRTPRELSPSVTRVPEEVKGADQRSPGLSADPWVTVKVPEGGSVWSAIFSGMTTRLPGYFRDPADFEVFTAERVRTLQGVLERTDPSQACPTDVNEVQPGLQIRLWPETGAVSVILPCYRTQD